MPVNTSVNNRFLNQPVTPTAVSYTALISDVIIEVTSTSAIRTITLPAPSATGNVGKAYLIKDTSGGASVNNIVIAPASGTIDSGTSVVISANYGSVQVFCDGSNYYSSYAPGTGTLGVVKQTFTASGTYTPTVGMLYCEVEILGGGGAGGGSSAVPGGGMSSGAGGGSGEYAFGIFSASQIGVSQSVTIGAGGAGSAGAIGGTGGTTSLGSAPLISALGGLGGTTASSLTGTNDSYSSSGGLGGTGGGGLSAVVHVAGQPGSQAFGNYLSGVRINPSSGNGASSQFGGGGIGLSAPTAGTIQTGPGNAGLGYGSGGSGGVTIQVGGPAYPGGNGAAGVIFITEYIATTSPNLPVVALAKAYWTRQSSLVTFTPGATVVQTSFPSDAGTTPSNSGSRIDLSALTQTEGSGLTISPLQVTITQGGTYQIAGNASFVQSTGTATNCVIQCVRNTTSVLGIGICQAGTPITTIETGSFIIIAELSVGDTIDFRANTNQTPSFTFINIELSITQLPSTTIIPISGWSAVAGTSQSMTISNNYYAQNASLTTFTLPVTASAGTTMRIAGVGAGGWKVAQNAGQSINFGNQVTTTGTGGSISSGNRYDAIELFCAVANTQWTVLTAAGNLSVA
jgi:hypothetical protein